MVKLELFEMTLSLARIRELVEELEAKQRYWGAVARIELKKERR